MKISFYISVATSALSLILAVIVLAVGYGNQVVQTEIQGHQKDVQKQQADLQKQQEIINTAVQIQQKVGPALLQDMANVSAKDEPMKALLLKHGFTVGTPAPAPATGGGAPATPSEPALRN